jgi:hypothetical protein
MCLSLLAPWWAIAAANVEYKNVEGFRVAVSSVGKLHGHLDKESKFEFYSPENQKLCALDYSSEDGEHGFGVVKAEWTPDGRYFVFSISSSGGHQPWHTPTLFYSPKHEAILSLDSYVDASGISKAEFSLKAPNTLLTEAWNKNEKMVPVSVSLDNLTAGNRKLHRILRCVGGKTLRAKLSSRGL